MDSKLCDFPKSSPTDASMPISDDYLPVDYVDLNINFAQVHVQCGNAE